MMIDVSMLAPVFSSLIFIPAFEVLVPSQVSKPAGIRVHATDLLLHPNDLFFDAIGLVDAPFSGNLPVSCNRAKN